MRYLTPLLALLFLLPVAASAATLSVSPGSTSVSSGNIVTVRIVTNTQGQAVNAAEGTLQFPTDLLDVVSVSKGGSIFSLWVEEPTFSNGRGTVTFNGGVPNPGYTGVGTVVTVTFHAKRAGVATVSLSDAAVRANDGFGTNVLSGSGSGQITIADAAVVAPTPTTPTAPKPIPTAPTGPNAISALISSTHPDQALWYSDANPRLSWTLPAGATAVQTIVGDTANVVPTVTYQPAISEKQIKELVDGIAYFNVRAKTAGGWGPVSSYRLQIDATPPSLGNPTFSYDLVRRQLVITNIEATDETSGLTKLELVIDEAEPILIRPEEVINGTYRRNFNAEGELTLLSAAAAASVSGGTHTAVLSAFDQANNRVSATGAFVVPVALINQTLFELWGFSISLLWFIILMLLLVLASLAAAAYAWYKLLTTHTSSRTKAAKREQIVHRSLSMFRTDLERHLRALDAADGTRALSEEEAKLKKDLEENLSDLERYLKKEFKKFDI